MMLPMESASSKSTRGQALRIGIIGAGFIGAVHARAARRAGARVVGVTASTSERTRQAVERTI
jgi:predicted dehydrogenase